ncbi:hypothetical protein CR513_52021, partial [Mucuna pruriens]
LKPSILIYLYLLLDSLAIFILHYLCVAVGGFILKVEFLEQFIFSFLLTLPIGAWGRIQQPNEEQPSTLSMWQSRSTSIQLNCHITSKKLKSRKGQKPRSRRSLEEIACITNALWWIRSSAFWLVEVNHCRSTMAIVVEYKSTEFTPCSETESARLCRVCQRLAETMLDKCQSRPCRTSLYQESSTDLLYDLDPKIELTLCRLRKARNIVVSNSSDSVSSSDNNNYATNSFDFVEYSSTRIFAKHMENNERTLKELATPDVMYQPWCIQYPQLEPTQTYELKYGLINLLPKRRPPQTFERIPCGLFHNETVGDTRRLYQNEGISILLGRSSKRLVVLTANSL